MWWRLAVLAIACAVAATPVASGIGLFELVHAAADAAPDWDDVPDAVAVSPPEPGVPLTVRTDPRERFDAVAGVAPPPSDPPVNMRGELSGGALPPSPDAPAASPPSSPDVPPVPVTVAAPADDGGSSAEPAPREPAAAMGPSSAARATATEPAPTAGRADAPPGIDRAPGPARSTAPTADVAAPPASPASPAPEAEAQAAAAGAPIAEAPGVAAAAAVAAAAVAGAAAVAIFASPVLALYRRIVSARALEHPLRRELMAFVKRNPGATCAEAARAAGVHFTTAEHHLRILGEFGHVAVRPQASGARFFENHGRFTREEQDALALLRKPENAAFVRALASAPDAGVTRLAGVLGIAKSTASRRASLLAKAGVLELAGGRLAVTPRALGALASRAVAD